LRGGGNSSDSGCVTPVEARAFNKIWFGLTRDGSAVSPALANGFEDNVGGQRRWFSLTRGTNLNYLAGTSPFAVASDLVAVELGDPTLATSAFINAKGNGADGWQHLTYADLNRAFDKGLADQRLFSDINTDKTDLSAFRDHGGKLLMYHGLSDILIPPQGSIHYYRQVVEAMGGLPAVQAFYRFYLVPGMSHAFANGTANSQAHVPLPEHDEFYAMLTRWVEAGQVPSRYDIAARDGSNVSAPLCVYPLKSTFVGPTR
jgi:feruloyl esterase